MNLIFQNNWNFKINQVKIKIYRIIYKSLKKIYNKVI